LEPDLFVFILVVRESQAGFWVLRSNQPPLIRSVFKGIWIIAPSWVGFLILWMSVLTTLFMYHDIVNGLWTALCQMYAHAHNDAHICELYRDVYHASQATLGLSVVDFFGYLQFRWEELAQYKPLSDFLADAAFIVASRLNGQHTYQFLLGLKPEFETLHTHILNTSPIPSLYEAYATIDSDECRRRLGPLPLILPLHLQ
jgi:hypothetical protein